MMFKKIIRSYLIFIGIVFLCACPPGTQTTQKPVRIVNTVPEEMAADYQTAAVKYLELAQITTGKLRALYQLKAAEMYQLLNQNDKTLQTLKTIDHRVLPANRLIDYQLLLARLHLQQGHTDFVIQVLDDVNESQLNAEQKKALYHLRIEFYGQTENWLEKAYSHLDLDKQLTGTEQLQNHKALWHTLMKLTPQMLDLFNPGVPPQQGSGWFALAYIIKSYRSQPEVLEVALEDWKRSYPRHPADPQLYETVLAAGSHLPADIANIAVLLPASGQYARAAKVIKEGLIAAHFEQASNSQLHFFDVASDALSGQSNVVQQYQLAINTGAEVVIGPLQKSSIEELVTGAELSIPVLALNRINTQLNYPNLFQFGLAPEDEAALVSTYAKEHNYKRAVVLAPQSKWGKRIAQSFSQHWQQQGGQIISLHYYNEKDNDFRDTLIPLLGVDISKQRYQKLKKLLRRSVDFEPRRRQDIDFLFLVANPLKARQLVPQLKFHHSGTLPIIATSHAYAAVANPRQDIDLEKLIIPDMPWILSEDGIQDPVYLALQSQTDKYPNSLRRLFALGVDSFRLLTKLNQMSRDEEMSYPGATGILTINSHREIKRRMPWAQFINGHLVKLQ